MRTLANFVGVVTPRSLNETVIYPKERRLIDIAKRQTAEGIQTWVYVHMTGKRNIQPRLKALLEREGLRVGVLRSGDVDPKEREEWIADHGRDFDVVISHPQLVSTGLDLFSKAEGGHNYATIVFYETGYNLFTMRQAARRAWRIGQPRDCRVYYLYYKATMQHRAMQLMSRKMAAAQALEGEFSEDGLAAMAGEDNLQMALARSLADRIDASDMQRSWTRVSSGPRTPIATKTSDHQPIDPPRIDEPGSTSGGKPVPLDPVGAFACVLERIFAVDVAFAAVARASHPERDTISEPVAKPATRPESVTLQLHQPETETDSGFAMPDLDDELLARMFANLAANGMTLGDLV